MHLQSKVILKGILWSLADTFANFALKFFFALAITRLLTPRDYGLVAYMGLFLGIAGWLAEGGFGNALIQKRDPDEIDFSTGYFFNVTVSLFFLLLYFFSAPLVADYFNEPELKSIIRVMSINLLVDSLAYIHLIKLIKQIEFKERALLNFIVSIVSGTIGLLMAYYGYGYWALVFQTLTGGVLRMFGLWFIVKWMPVIKFSWHSFREQFRFGSKVFVQGLFESIFREIYSLIIGKSFHTTALGNYSRGQKFYDLFIVQTGSAFMKVLYPAMTKQMDEKEIHKSIYVRIYNLLFFIMAPLTTILYLISDPLIRVLLTDKWIAAIPYMKLYFCAGFVVVLLSFNSSTVLSANYPRLFLIMDIIHKLLMAVALVITFTISIRAIILSWLAVYYVYYFFYEWMMYRLHYYERSKYPKMLQVLIGLIPVILFYYLSIWFVSHPYAVLIINLIFQPLIYYFFMRIWKFPIYKEFAGVIKSLLPPGIHFLL